MKQAASTSLLSCRWKSLWLQLPVIFFQQHYTSDSSQTSAFSGWAKSVMEGHRGPTIDELRVGFDLDSDECQSLINRLLYFALAKQVKRLTFNFSPRVERLFQVNIFAMEKLEVSHCPGLCNMDILAPKLVSFTYHGRPITLHIRDASLLSELSIGNGDFRGIRGDIVTFAYHNLRSYFPQLEYLCCNLIVNEYDRGNQKVDLVIDNLPAMSKLKHLELCVTARSDLSLLSWATIIEAAPVLEKLSLKFPDASPAPNRLYKRNIVKHKGRPLERLKTVELDGELGLPIEYEFLSYVVENSVMLNQVIHFQSYAFRREDESKYLEERVEEFNRNLPPKVNMVKIHSGRIFSLSRLRQLWS